MTDIAIWTAQRDQGSSWQTTLTCPHGTHRQPVYFGEFLVSAAQVQAAAAPDKLLAYHRSVTGCTCALVLSPIQVEVLTHAR